MNKVEEYIQNYQKTCSNEVIVPTECGKAYQAWLTPDHAREIANIAKEEIINKVCKWIDKHILEYVYAKEYGQGIGINGDWYDEFRKAMEE